MRESKPPPALSPTCLRSTVRLVTVSQPLGPQTGSTDLRSTRTLRSRTIRRTGPASTSGAAATAGAAGGTATRSPAVVVSTSIARAKTPAKQIKIVESRILRLWISSDRQRDVGLRYAADRLCAVRNPTEAILAVSLKDHKHRVSGCRTYLFCTRTGRTAAGSPRTGNRRKSSPDCNGFLGSDYNGVFYSSKVAGRS
jgi:hypothetical protein